MKRTSRLRPRAALALLLAGMAAAAVVGVTAAQAGVSVNSTDPFALSGFVPCANGGAGEQVDLSGELHTLITFTINDNHVSGKELFQVNASGTGETSGDKYQGMWIAQEDLYSDNLLNGQYEGSFVGTFRMTGQGPGNNFWIRETVHFTLNANGTATVIHINPSFDCS